MKVRCWLSLSKHRWSDYKQVPPPEWFPPPPPWGLFRLQWPYWTFPRSWAPYISECLKCGKLRCQLRGGNEG